MYQTKPENTVFIYVFKGSGHVNRTAINSGECILFGDGYQVTIETKDGIRFLLISGKPLNEPIAWGGPIVMNTKDELMQAFQELKILR